MKISIEHQLSSRYFTGALEIQRAIRQEPCLKNLSIVIEIDRETGSQSVISIIKKQPGPQQTVVKAQFSLLSLNHWCLLFLSSMKTFIMNLKFICPVSSGHPSFFCPNLALHAPTMLSVFWSPNVSCSISCLFCLIYFPLPFFILWLG